MCRCEGAGAELRRHQFRATHTARPSDVHRLPIRSWRGRQYAQRCRRRAISALDTTAVLFIAARPSPATIAATAARRRSSPLPMMSPAVDAVHALPRLIRRMRWAVMQRSLRLAAPTTPPRCLCRQTRSVERHHAPLANDGAMRDESTLRRARSRCSS